MVEGDESSWLRMAKYPAGFGWLPALIDSPDYVTVNAGVLGKSPIEF